MSGFDLRDEFALKAMASIVANPSFNLSAMSTSRRDICRVVAEGAYGLADAMLAERDVLATVEFPKIEEQPDGN